MDKWLASIGLKGRALQLARTACADNLVEDVRMLRDLAEDKEEFDKTFPQSMVRRIISKALATDGRSSVDAKASASVGAKQSLLQAVASVEQASPASAALFEYACHWTTTKMQTSVAAVKMSCVTGDESLVFHFTSIDAAKVIFTSGFRMSASGQGGGGVYFTKLSPARYQYGQASFKRLALIDCYGEEHLEEYSTAPNFQVVLVCSVKTALLRPVPGGRHNAAMVSRTLIEGIQNPGLDGNYYLQPKVIKRAFQLEDPDSGIFHAVTSVDLDVGEQLRLQVRSRYRSVEEAWISFDVKKKNALSRSDFKRVVHTTLGITCTDEQRKQLRHQLDPQNLKVVTFKALSAFIDGTQQKQVEREMMHNERRMALRALPMDVPSLPEAYLARVNVENQLKVRLLDHESKPCIAAQGMGGVGKSVITSAVVRSQEIRERFEDGIAWIGMNQAPLLLALQQRCFFQLTKEQLPLKYRTSVEVQHACLSEALISKTCLVVLDDVWSKQHAKCFEVIDTTTPSKLLISSRIAGLLKNSSEVKLALMTNDEAVNLLAHGAGLDFEEVPHAIAEVVGLCGRLPLCLNIAASIIADHGENWQEEVLPQLRKGFSQLTTGDEDDANELSIQDSVIVTSVASIVGKDAEKIKLLFILSAVFGEDQRVPCPLFVTLWAAAVKASAQMKNKITVKHQISVRDAKKMTGALVRRSLFLELVRGSIQLHDIVRDYVLARVEKDRKSTGGLQLLQRMFVSEFLASQEQWEDVAESTIRRGKEYDWYLSTGALQWHMQHACATRPLVKDALACSWLLQVQEQIVACAVKAIPLEAQVELAGDFAQAGEMEKAIRILHEVIQRREMSLSEIQANAKQLFSYVDSIPVSKRSEAVTNYDVTVAYKMYSHSDKVSAHAAFVFSRLMATLDQGASLLGHLTIGTLVIFKATELIGYQKPRPSPSKSELDEGARLLRRCANEFEAAILVGEISNPLEAYLRTWAHCLYPFYFFAVDYWTEPLDSKETARVQVAELTKAAADYEYGTSHPYKRINYAKADVFLETGNALALLALWWCDKRSVHDFLTKWEDGELRAIAEGDGLFLEYFSVVPVLRVIPALDCLWQVLEAVGMSWQKGEHFQFRDFPWAWTVPGDEACCFHPETCRMVTKLNCFLCAPDQVETAEVLNYLPHSGSCHWVHDRTNHTISSAEPLEVLISKAALACGESLECFKLATSHANAAAAQHLAQQKVMHAQAALGSAMWRREQAGGSTTQISEETLGVLDVALKSAQKMRLRKYTALIEETTMKH